MQRNSREKEERILPMREQQNHRKPHFYQKKILKMTTSIPSTIWMWEHLAECILGKMDRGGILRGRTVTEHLR